MRKLLITLLPLAVVLIGVDFLGRFLSERAISQVIATNLDTGGTTPETDIGGWSFLVQVLGGRFDEVTVDLPVVHTRSLRDVSADVELTSVRLPLGEVITGNFDALTADRADGRAVIPAASLSTALGRPVQLGSAPNGDVIIDTAFDFNGQAVPVSATLTASVTDTVLQLRANTLEAASVPLTEQLSAQLNTDFSVDIPLAGLPFPLASAQVSAVGGDLIVTAGAVDVSVADLR